MVTIDKLKNKIKQKKKKTDRFFQDLVGDIPSQSGFTKHRNKIENNFQFQL